MYEVLSTILIAILTLMFAGSVFAGLAFKPERMSPKANALVYLCASSALVSGSLSSTYFMGRIMHGPYDFTLSAGTLLLAMCALGSMFVIFSFNLNTAPTTQKGA